MNTHTQASFFIFSTGILWHRHKHSKAVFTLYDFGPILQTKVAHKISFCTFLSLLVLVNIIQYDNQWPIWIVATKNSWELLAVFDFFFFILKSQSVSAAVTCLKSTKWKHANWLKKNFLPQAHVEERLCFYASMCSAQTDFWIALINDVSGILIFFL